MVLGTLFAGSIVGITAALIAVIGFAAPFWLGLALWWGLGTAVMMVPLVALALRSDDAEISDDLATA